MELFLSVFFIYIFVVIGYFAKKIFKEQIQEKSFVLLSIYFLQPILIFWGLSSKSIDLQLLFAPFFYIVIIAISIVFSLVLATNCFKDQKDRSIATTASVIGNTGNLGIPLGIALFGAESVIYTSIINILNIFIINSVGVFMYSRGNYSVIESLKNILKLPAIWFGLLATVLNLLHVEFSEDFQRTLTMGAYATMVLQLVIFGMYLCSVKLKKINYKLFGVISFIKFIFMPGIALATLMIIYPSPIIIGVVLLELSVPAAVTNVNLAALYDCKPSDTTAMVFLTSVTFLGFVFFLVYILNTLNIMQL